MKHSPFEAFVETLLGHRPALPCFSFENSGPLIVIGFASPVSPSTEERLQDGGDSACGLWFVCFGLFGCPCSFLHHLTVLPFLQR